MEEELKKCPWCKKKAPFNEFINHQVCAKCQTWNKQRAEKAKIDKQRSNNVDIKHEEKKENINDKPRQNNVEDTTIKKRESDEDKEEQRMTYEEFQRMINEMPENPREPIKRQTAERKYEEAEIDKLPEQSPVLEKKADTTKQESSLFKWIAIGASVFMLYIGVEKSLDNLPPGASFPVVKTTFPKI